MTARQRVKAGHPTQPACANCERLTVALNAAHRMLSKQAAAWCAQESELVTAQREVEVLSENCANWERKFPDVAHPKRKRRHGAILPVMS